MLYVGWMDGWEGMDGWMVTIGRGYSESTLGANKEMRRLHCYVTAGAE